VVIFGVGGLGHLAVQYAKITGAEVVAVDLNPERLATATALGADHVVDARTEDPAAVLQAMGGADAAIATAVSPRAFEQALGSLARGGTLVCVGMPAQNEMGLPIFETVVGGLTVTGSIVGTHQDVVDVFELHRRGLTRVERTDALLEDVNEAIAAVLDGTAGAARTVLRLRPAPVAAAPAIAGAAAR
jgi:propanol-preferring alcohol dehydrogenase